MTEDKTDKRDRPAIIHVAPSEIEAAIRAAYGASLLEQQAGGYWFPRDDEDRIVQEVLDAICNPTPLDHQ